MTDVAGRCGEAISAGGTPAPTTGAPVDHCETRVTGGRAILAVVLPYGEPVTDHDANNGKSGNPVPSRSKHSHRPRSRPPLARSAWSPLFSSLIMTVLFGRR
jgi:hypothetical protein